MASAGKTNSVRAKPCLVVVERVHGAKTRSFSWNCTTTYDATGGRHCNRQIVALFALPEKSFESNA
jgi:hypothetical protein